MISTVSPGTRVHPLHRSGIEASRFDLPAVEYAHDGSGPCAPDRIADLIVNNAVDFVRL
jgi:hypothetical protein